MPVSISILLIFQTCSTANFPLSPVCDLTFVQSLLPRCPLYHTYFFLTFSYFSFSVFTHSFCYNPRINFKTKHVAINFTLQEFVQFSLSSDLYITRQCLCSEASGVEFHTGCWDVSRTDQLNTTCYSVPHITPDPSSCIMQASGQGWLNSHIIPIPITKVISITLCSSSWDFQCMYLLNKVRLTLQRCW
jgi:hypothetical protein